MAKHTYEYVKQFIENSGYKVISKDYINNRSKLNLTCINNHDCKISFGSFQYGVRCSICSRNKKFTIEEVRNFLEEYNYSLLSKEYKNSSKKLKVSCPLGHEYDVTFANFKSGKRCSYCKGGVRLEYITVKGFIEDSGYKLLTRTYENAHKKLKIMCSEGHEYEANFNNFKSGYRCPKCYDSNKFSKTEKRLFNIVKSLISVDIIENDRSQVLNPLTDKYLELDIWIPGLKKAIEFNGSYWHSSNYSKEKDRIKQEQCLTKGIDLLVIDEKDWLTNENICIQNIKEFLNV